MFGENRGGDAGVHADHHVLDALSPALPRTWPRPPLNIRSGSAPTEADAHNGKSAEVLAAAESPRPIPRRLFPTPAFAEGLVPTHAVLPGSASCLLPLTFEPPPPRTMGKNRDERRGARRVQAFLSPVVVVVVV